MNNEVHQLMMNQVINLFGWNHIRTIEIQNSKEIIIEISRLEPTTVPAFLLGMDIVKIKSQVVIVNRNEEVSLSEYYSLEGLLLGYVVLYKEDIVIEVIK